MRKYLPLKLKPLTPVHFTIVLINCLIFIYETFLGDKVGTFIHQFAFTPIRFKIQFFDSPFKSIYPAFSYAFLHGNATHLFFNLTFLLAFGRELEKKMGSFRYFTFYIVSIFSAIMAQFSLNSSDTIPIVGASGAISSLAAAMLFTYIKFQAHTAQTSFNRLKNLFTRPSFLFISFWTVLQTLDAFLSLFHPVENTAWMTHVGGFLTGWFLSYFFLKPSKNNYTAS